ncbi:MAG TPA: type VI secretion system lipoprotein TssJ [Bordetella sp.]|uniref:type VI secretion system lipoprotein TssJ n=1 Tax=Bordetella sp. TaxID=28081 RepID=UPI002ED22B9A
MSQLPANLPGKSLLPRLAAFLPCALAALLLAGCGGGGGPDASRKQVMANVNWEFAKDAVMVEVAAAPNLNEYAGQSHTLLLGVYQMADPAPFYKMLADSNALARSLSSEKGGDAYVQFTRYIVAPGQHSILILDRAQKAKYIGLVAGYYKLSGATSARLFEIPLSVSSDGLITTTWSAAPMTLAVRMNFGADGILNADKLNHDPSAQKMQEAVPLDGGGKEIKLTNESIQDAVQQHQTLQKIGN